MFTHHCKNLTSGTDINLIFQKIVYLTLRITLFTYSKKVYRTRYWKTVFRLAFSIMDYFDTRENHWTSGALHKTPRRAAFKSRSSTQSEEIRPSTWKSAVLSLHQPRGLFYPFATQPSSLVKIRKQP